MQMGSADMDIRTAALVAALGLGFATDAVAQQTTTQQQQSASEIAAQIDALQQRLQALEAQLEDLKASTAADLADVRRVQGDATQVTVANGRPTFATADGQFRASIRVLAQLDAAHYDQGDTPTPDNRRSDASNPGDLNSGANFRRARLGVEGVLYRDWNYGFTAEFGGSGSESPALNQAYVEYAGWKPWANVSPLRFRIGAWATPTSLEDATSNAELLFLERPAPAELVRNIAGGDGRTGFGVFANGERWYTSGVITGALVANTSEFDEQTGYLARAAFVPLRGENYAVHLGANLAGVLDPADTNAGFGTTKTIRLRERPELRVDAQRFADTGAIPAESVTAYGLELGGAWRNFYAAGEVFSIDLERSDGISDPRFGGWYVQGAWTLTGETRRWNAANGGFQGVRPTNALDPRAKHWGAWEVGARYSVLDLNDNEGALGTAPAANAVRGGEQIITTLGLNWYPNNAVRFMLDYQWVDIDRLDPEVTGTIVTAVPGVGAQIGQDYQVISLRSQLSF